MSRDQQTARKQDGVTSLRHMRNRWATLKPGTKRLRKHRPGARGFASQNSTSGLFSEDFKRTFPGTLDTCSTCLDFIL